ELKRLALDDAHLVSYTKAVLDAEIGKLAKKAHDAVFSGKSDELELKIPQFEATRKTARMQLEASVRDGTWTSKVKGRDLLKAFCARHRLKYEHFRNSLIANLGQPPEGLDQIVKKIKEESLAAGL